MNGDLATAECLCNARLARRPGDPAAEGLLGVIAVKTRRLDLAMTLLPRATSAFARDASLHTHLGAALLLLGRSADALRPLDRALTLAPRDTLALNVRACALANLGRFEESIACCDRALAVQPDYVAAIVNRGNACAALGRHAQALASFEEALRIEPGAVEAINNCANALKSLGRREEALRRYEEALALRPDYAEAAFNHGVTLAELGRVRDATASYERAAAIQPDHVLARYNLSLAWLLLGRYARAWQHHDAWLARAALAGRRRALPAPRWDGRADVSGRTVLLHADEGLGDTLQFCRYAAEVAALGARVVLEVQRPLVPLLRGLAGVRTIVARGARLPHFDLHCSLMNLPAALDTRLATIPWQGPYIRGDAKRVERWGRRLARPANGPMRRIGLVWSGNPAHANDACRSVPLAAVLPLLDQPADWVSLQKDVREDDADLLARTTALRHFGPQIRDFADTAALIARLDLVITVDTSVAHLAGAMGKPVWILLPLLPDWRWLLRRADSPWYPSARLFRQSAPGDWTGVVRRVRRALKRLDRS